MVSALILHAFRVYLTGGFKKARELIWIHRWSGSSMVSALILHAFRVYLTGGFKKARELIWMTGIILGLCTVLFGVTGY